MKTKKQPKPQHRSPVPPPGGPMGGKGYVRSQERKTIKDAIREWNDPRVLYTD